ncbi:hypothetical protein FB451DRAFT_1386024 [Mycena latifolia]|nr:hypothetical protein FB451DRAFT_1386024 [Mycena latifolia]
MGKKDKNKLKNKTDEKGKKKKKKKSITFHTVTQEPDGALTCDCDDFLATGKACQDILATGLYINFGPAKPYLEDAQGPDLHGPRAKGKRCVPKKSKRQGRGPRPLADHKVEEELFGFLDQIEKGWSAFGDDDQFSDAAEEPERKKAKVSAPDGVPGTRVGPGRPPASTPLHPNRSGNRSAKFSSKRGPKALRGKNSLLPPLNIGKKSPTKIGQPGNDRSGSGSEWEPESGSESDDVEKSPITPQKGNSDGKPPPLSTAILERKAVFIEGLETAFSAEDLDILDIDWIRWNADYKLRADEVDEMGSLLEALSLNLRQGVLVIGPSYAFEAQRLRRVDWTPSDDPPIDSTGAPAFPERSLLKKAWYHSQKVTLQKLLIFHHQPERDHWLLFSIDLSTDEVVCYEPLSQHGESVDIKDMCLIAQFFKPQRPSKRPSRKEISSQYKLLTLGIQRDGASCGFWMATITFLTICEVSITKSCINVLSTLGVENLKEHWKCLLTSWRVEEDGLAYEPVNNFLDYWGIGYKRPRTGLIAPRPEWIPRFDPKYILEVLSTAAAAASGQNASNKEEDPSPSLDSSLHQMPSAKEVDVVIQDLQTAFKNEKLVLTFQTETLGVHDMKRFIDFRAGRANDEIINLFVAVFNWSPDLNALPAHNHFGSLFGLPLPSRKFKILTTFFYPKLKDLLKAENPSTGNPESAKDDFNVLTNFVLPINKPAHVHWFFIEIDFADEGVNIYDSWAENQKAYYTTPDTGPYATALALAILASQIIVEASGDKLSDITPARQWTITNVPMPTQSNGINCGFFMTMAVLHLVHFGELHAAHCPPNLRFSSSTMKKNRTILLTSILTWCTSYNTAIAKNVSQLKDGALSESDETEFSPPRKALTVAQRKSKSLYPEPSVSETLIEALIPSPVSNLAQQIPQQDPHDNVSISPSPILQDEEPEKSKKTTISFSPVPSSVDGEQEFSDDERMGLVPNNDSPHNPIQVHEDLVRLTTNSTAPLESDSSSVWASSLTSLPSTPPPPPPLRRGPARNGRPATLA